MKRKGESVDVLGGSVAPYSKRGGSLVGNGAAEKTKPKNWQLKRGDLKFSC